MTAVDELRMLVGELTLLFSESAEFHAELHPSGAGVLRQAAEIATLHHRRLTAWERRGLIAFVGLSNVGKSTVINALLETPIAPQKNGPCTAVPIEFAWGERPTLEVEYAGSCLRRRVPCEDLRQLREELNYLANDPGGDASRTIRRVMVLLPHPLLKRVTIADTPGFGAAQTESAVGAHEWALKPYLREEVARVVWVVSGEQGIMQRELDFYRHECGEFCDDVVVTRCGEWNDRDREQFRRRFSRPFGRRAPRFLFTELQIEPRYGISELRDYLATRCDHPSQIEIAAESLRMLCQDINDWFNRCEVSPRAGRWSPHSWRRWLKKTPEHAGFRDELTMTLAGGAV